jgi:hypothetical protein
MASKEDKRFVNEQIRMYGTSGRAPSEKQIEEARGHMKPSGRIQQIFEQRRQKRLLKDYKILNRQERYAKTIAGRIGSGFGKAVKFIQAPTRTIYERMQPSLSPYTQQRLKRYGQGYDNMRTIGGVRSGARGRPRGTYDKRYAEYGGVYGFRKIQAQQLRMQRMEYLRSRAITPEQQQILANIMAQKRGEAMNPEARVIPSTQGRVPMRSFMQEIDDYSRLVE